MHLPSNIMQKTAKYSLIFPASSQSLPIAIYILPFVLESINLVPLPTEEKTRLSN